MIACPADETVDRFDGHCPVCHGDPDRCPAVGPRIASSAGMRYSVEPVDPIREAERRHRALYFDTSDPEDD